MLLSFVAVSVAFQPVGMVAAICLSIVVADETCFTRFFRMRFCTKRLNSSQKRRFALCLASLKAWMVLKIRFHQSNLLKWVSEWFQVCMNARYSVEMIFPDKGVEKQLVGF